MVRKLALAVSLALGTLSVPVYALGLGELSSKSTLNQNFNGDIALLSVRPDELDSVRVRLADAEAFERAGVERPFYLSLLKFEPTLGAGGRPVVRVSSGFPIREPFLNFLVEVNWPNGRLLREYTVLLDPPVTTMRRPPTVAPATRPATPVTRPATVAPRPAQPTVSAVPGQYGPVQANDTAWGIASRLRPAGVSMEQMMMALLDANPEAFIDGNINRLRRGKILRVPSLAEIQQIGRQQARQAYRAQQDQWLARRDAQLQERAQHDAGDDASMAADSDADVDDQLRIATPRPDGEGVAGAGEDDASSPTSSDLKERLIVARENAETSRQEAETLRSQVDDLLARLSDMQKLLSLKDDQLARLQDRVATEGVSEEAMPAVAAGEAAEASGTAPDTTGASAATETVPEPPEGLELTPGDPGAPAAADVEIVIDQGEPAAADAETALDPVEQAIAEVEAAAQALNAESTTPDAIEAAPETPALDPDFTVADVPPQVDPNAIVEQAGAPTAPTAPTAPEIEEVVVVDDTGTTEIVVVEGGEAPTAPVEPVAEPAPPTATMQDDAPADRAGGSLLPSPLASTLDKFMVPIAAAGVVLLGLLGWLFMRGRRQPDADSEPAVVDTAGAALPATDDEGPGVDQPIANETLTDLPDSAFLDEFSPSDINALQDETGEVDPVSEADVYIAYGRYQQAEDLLRQAMERDPERLALKHKLLEVQYATRNGAAFTALAQEMVDAGQDVVDEEAWAHAQDMGRELVPDHPLFQSAQSTDVDTIGLEDAAATVDTDTVDDDTLALDGVQLADLDDAYESESDATDTLDSAPEVSISLDLDDDTRSPGDAPDPLLAAELDTTDTSESISLDDLESLDFALPETETGAKTTAGADADDSAFDLSTDNHLDLDAMVAEAEAAVDSRETELDLESEFSAEELQAQLDELSDLSVLDSDLESASTQTNEPSAPLSLDVEDSNVVNDELTPALDLETVDPDSQISEADVATKLDLARAYVDMGDEEGARSILEEVLVEGSAQQKTDAESLMTELT